MRKGKRLLTEGGGQRGHCGGLSKGPGCEHVDRLSAQKWKAVSTFSAFLLFLDTHRLQHWLERKLFFNNLAETEQKPRVYFGIRGGLFCATKLVITVGLFLLWTVMSVVRKVRPVFVTFSVSWRLIFKASRWKKIAMKITLGVKIHY